MIQWRFPSNDNGENKGINDSGIATFKGTPLKSLAREICQNSLDAARKDTVHVEFSVFSIPTESVPGIDELKDAFNRCLDFWGAQKAITTKEFYSKAIEVAEKHECHFLRISDYNTTGLTGTTEIINTNWTNLTKSSGASDKKGTAGGSYGIGKYAPFACSDFATVFYSTYNEDKEEAYQGVSRLVTFRRDDDETTAGIGYYGNEKNTPAITQAQLDPEFSRTLEEYGTDIYIAAYKYATGDWQKEIIVSLLDSFLGAIWTNKLTIDVGGIVISRDTLYDIIETYKDDLVGYTESYYSVLSSTDTKWITENFIGLGLIKLGLLVGLPDLPRRVAMVRKTGMKIMDKDHLPGHAPCAGILFIEGDKINEKLRVMENPEHTKWQPDRASNPIAGKALLRELNKFIKDEIEKIITSGSGDEIDAVGVGAYLPDNADEPKDKSHEETVSDTIVEIERKVTRKRNRLGTDKSNETNGDIMDGEDYKLPGGDDSEWFHDNGHTNNRSEKPGQPAHSDEKGIKTKGTRKGVTLSKFVALCVDKAKGQYMLMIIPNESVSNATIEVYLSAETRNYAAPLVGATMIGGNQLNIKENTISGLDLVKNQTIRLKLEMDYNEICALEVKAYGIKE